MRRRDLQVRLPFANLLINGAAFSIVSFAFLSHHSHYQVRLHPLFQTFSSKPYEKVICPPLPFFRPIQSSKRLKSYVALQIILQPFCLIIIELGADMQEFNKGWDRMLDYDFVQNAIANLKEDETCSQLHSWGCNVKAMLQFYAGVKSVLKMYLVVHLVPLLLFKFKKLKQNPREQILKFFRGLVCSLIFAGGNSAIPRRVVCLVNTFFKNQYFANVLTTACGGIGLIIESPNRQIEIALYGFAKGWESGYLMMKRRKWPARILCGNLWINAVAIAIIVNAFMNQPEILREGYRKILNILIGSI